MADKSLSHAGSHRIYEWGSFNATAPIHPLSLSIAGPSLAHVKSIAAHFASLYIIDDSGVCHISGTPLPIGTTASAKSSATSLALPSNSPHIFKPLSHYAGFECLGSRRVVQIAMGFSHALLLVESLHDDALALSSRSTCAGNHSVSPKSISTMISVWSFGSNKFGQCGVSPPVTASTSSSSSYSTTRSSASDFYIPPKIIPSFAYQTAIRQIACGDKHSLVLDGSGKLSSFGSTLHGLLGRTVFENERANGYSFIPQLVQCSSSVTHISAAATHSLLTCSDGSCYSFGLGLYGALGHDDMVTREQPQLIEELEGLRVVQVAAGGWHSLFLTDQGSVYSCGSNAQGQLGRVKEEAEPNAEVSTTAMETSSQLESICTASYSPELISIPELEQIEDEWIISIATGAHHSICVSNKHRVWQMGNLQLYDPPALLASDIDCPPPTFEQRATPTLVPLDYYSSPIPSTIAEQRDSKDKEEQSQKSAAPHIQVVCNRFASYLLHSTPQ